MMSILMAKNNRPTPNYLQEATDGKYYSLPVLPKKDHCLKTVAIKIFKILMEITLIPAIGILILSLKARWTVKFVTQETMKHLSPLAIQRLKERENKIRELAKKAGITHADKFKLYAWSNFKSPAGALGSSTIVIAPEYLVQPKDLPDDLKIERLEKNELSEEMWIIKFNKWLKTSFCPQEIKPFQSQLEVDGMLAFGKVWLNQFRNRKIFKTNFKAMMGHELAHCKYGHTTKHAFARFGWSLISILTLGISSLFEKHVLSPLYQRSEKEADIFSAKKFGAAGLINVFTEYAAACKTLHKKYPLFYDAKGNSLTDYAHPSFNDRIGYLKKFNLL